MSIAAIHASNAYNFSAASSQEYRQLTSALSSNDLAGAQQAFHGLGRVTQTVPAPPDPVQVDLRDLAAALEAGDLRCAQAIFIRLQADLSASQATPPDKSGVTTVSLLG